MNNKVQEDNGDKETCISIWEILQGRWDKHTDGF